MGPWLVIIIVLVVVDEKVLVLIEVEVKEVPEALEGEEVMKGDGGDGDGINDG